MGLLIKLKICRNVYHLDRRVQSEMLLALKRTWSHVLTELVSNAKDEIWILKIKCTGGERSAAIGQMLIAFLEPRALTIRPKVQSKKSNEKEFSDAFKLSIYLIGRKMNRNLKYKRRERASESESESEREREREREREKHVITHAKMRARARLCGPSVRPSPVR